MFYELKFSDINSHLSCHGEMVSPVLKDVPLQGSDQAGVMSILVRILAEQYLPGQTVNET